MDMRVVKRLGRWDQILVQSFSLMNMRGIRI